MKKLLSLALALLMLAVMLPVTAMAATAAPSWEGGVNFENVTTGVKYTNNLGEVMTSDETTTKTALVAYQKDGIIVYAADVWAAIKEGATEIYCKAGETVPIRDRAVDTQRTPDLTNNLTIYGNGATFGYGQISVNMTDSGKSANITVTVYDAKNIEIWGCTPNNGVTQNFNMINCTNIGTSATGSSGIMVYITDAGTGVVNPGTVNLVVKDCHIEKNSSGISNSANGTMTVTGTTFVDCAAGIKVSYKGEQTRTDTIENCTFTNCGCTEEMAGNTNWLKDDSAAIIYKNGRTGTADVTITNNTITDTLTKNTLGDIRVKNANATITPNGTTTTVNTGIKDTPETITGKVTADAKGNVTHVKEEGPTTIVIISPTQDTPKTDDQKNPATGANDLVAVAVAAAALALVGSAIILRKD